MSITITPAGEVEPVPYVLVNHPAFGILQPNGQLFREPTTRRADPYGTAPTVWFAETIAEGVRTAIATELEELFGIDPDGPSALRVVRLELGTDGVWRIPVADPVGYDYRPLDLDTELVSQWACGERAELSVEQARQVMREHKECAGMIPCRVRGRARAVLARTGRMVLADPRATHVWQSLDWPDRRWTGGRIGGRALIHLAGKVA